MTKADSEEGGFKLTKTKAKKCLAIRASSEKKAKIIKDVKK